jgi:WD40 repeat protein
MQKVPNRESRVRHRFPLWTAAFSPDGSRVVTASNDRTARLWDARTGDPLGVPMRHEGLVEMASFSPDGLRVVTAEILPLDCGMGTPANSCLLP